MVTVFVVPPLVTETVARFSPSTAFDVFTRAVMVPLLAPDVWLTESHGAAPVVVAVHDALELTIRF